MNDSEIRERKVFLDEAEAFLNQGDHQAVLELAQARLNRTPGDLDGRIMVCRIRILQGSLEEAGEMLREMEEILAGFSQIYACMGDICLRKGMLDSAQDFYRKYLGLNPDSPLSREVSERLKGIEDRRGQGAERKEEEDGQVPSDFQTVTLAELYIRQGHLGPAAEVLEAILRNDPQQTKAAEMLRDVRQRILPGGQGPAQGQEAVIAELSRWLDNIHRLRDHAA